MFDKKIAKIPLSHWFIQPVFFRKMSHETEEIHTIVEGYFFNFLLDTR
jgi:hypothetical protein